MKSYLNIFTLVFLLLLAGTTYERFLKSSLKSIKSSKRAFNDVVETPDKYRMITINKAGEFMEQQLLARGRKDRTTVTTFSVKIYYTREFKSATTDIQGFIQLIIDETNRGFVNSKVPIRIKLHCVEAADLNDISNGEEMIHKFAGSKGESRDGVERLLGSADAAVLLVADFDLCGIAYSWAGRTPVSVTSKDCATGHSRGGRYTVAHELGHNMGADHDRDYANNYWFPYGYGNHVGPAYLDYHGYMTIMAYPKHGHRRTINYWSSSDPSVKFRGEFPTGSKDTDNARVITETRAGT